MGIGINPLDFGLPKPPVNLGGRNSNPFLASPGGKPSGAQFEGFNPGIAFRGTEGFTAGNNSRGNLFDGFRADAFNNYENDPTRYDPRGQVSGGRFCCTA